MGRNTSFSKQVIVFFLVLSLFIRPTFASSVGGWSMGNPVAHGASVVYEGTKNVLINGADYVKKGAATITPTAVNVSKTLGKGVAGVALSVAVEQLLGAVDWVLDPANNQIRYTTGEPVYAGFTHTGSSVRYSSAAEACSAYFAARPSYKSFKLSAKIIDKSETFGFRYDCTLYSNANQTGGAMTGSILPREAVAEEEKTYPLPTLADKVISNAASGDAAAQQATTAAAADIVQEAAADQTGVKARPIAQQLEATSTTKPADAAAAAAANTATGTQTETKPGTAELALEFPTFCAWAPTLCEFAQTGIQSIDDAKAEYADKPQENTDTELEIPDPEEQPIDSDISFGGSCPAPLTSDVNFMGLNKTIEFSFDPVCQIAEFIKPVVISISAFSAALIVAGIRTEDD